MQSTVLEKGRLSGDISSPCHSPVRFFNVRKNDFLVKMKLVSSIEEMTVLFGRKESVEISRATKIRVSVEKC